MAAMTAVPACSTGARRLPVVANHNYVCSLVLHFISHACAESGYETPGPRAGQQPQQRPPSAPHLQHEPLGTRGYVVEGLDDIDHSNDEYMDDYYDDEVRPWPGCRLWVLVAGAAVAGNHSWLLDC